MYYSKHKIISIRLYHRYIQSVCANGFLVCQMKRLNGEIRYEENQFGLIRELVGLKKKKRNNIAGQKKGSSIVIIVCVQANHYDYRNKCD